MSLKAILGFSVLFSEEGGVPGMANMKRGSVVQEGGAPWLWESGAGMIREGGFHLCHLRHMGRQNQPFRVPLRKSRGVDDSLRQLSHSPDPSF